MEWEKEEPEKESSEKSSTNDQKELPSELEALSVLKLSNPDIISPSVKSRRKHSMQILRSPIRRKSSALSIASKPDRAQNILDSVLLRITTIRENPDILLTDDLGDLTTDVDDGDGYLSDDMWMENLEFDPYEDASRQIDEMQDKASSQREKIKEMEEVLEEQKRKAQSDSQRLRLQIEELEFRKKSGIEKINAQAVKISKLEDALATAEENLKNIKLQNLELLEDKQNLELESKSLLERLRISERDRQHIDAVYKGTGDTMQIELEALHEKLKSSMSKLHQEEETCSSLRKELKSKSLDVTWLRSAKSALNDKVKELEKKLQVSKVDNQVLKELKKGNQELRAEIEELRSNKAGSNRRLSEQITQEMQKSLDINTSTESIVLTNSNKGSQSILKLKDTQEIEHLNSWINKLKGNGVMGEKKIVELNDRLCALEKAPLEKCLSQDVNSMTMRSEQRAKKLEVQASKNSIIKEYQTKLEHLETEKNVIEAKFCELLSQISVLENSKKKTLDIQTSTISSLQTELSDVRSKLQEATNVQWKQNEHASALKLEIYKLNEERNDFRMKLKNRDNELEKSVNLRDKVQKAEEKLYKLKREKDKVEFANSQLSMKLQSVEEQMKLMQEQRTRYINIQKDTINELEKQQESTSKHNQRLKEKNEVLEEKLKILQSHEEPGEASLKIQENGTSGPVEPAPGSAKVEEWQKLLDSEKKASRRLTKKVRELTDKNREGRKLLVTLLKTNKKLGAKLKRKDKLRNHISNIQKKFITLLERELERNDQLSNNNMSTKDRIKVDSDILKLKARLEAERKIQRELLTWGAKSNSLLNCTDVSNVKEKYPLCESSEIPNKKRDECMDREDRVKLLLEELDVANDVSRLKNNFEQIKGQTFSSHHEYYMEILTLKDKLHLTSHRIENAREKAQKTLDFYRSTKSKLNHKLLMLTESLLREVMSQLKHWQESLRSQIEDKFSDPSGKKPSSELASLEQKKNEMNLKFQNCIAFLKTLVRVDALVLQLTNASEHALKEQWNISAMFPSLENLLSKNDEERLHGIAVVAGRHTRSGSIIGSNRTILKPSCSWCDTRNIVGHNFSVRSRFQVVCWKCHKYFLVDQSAQYTPPNHQRSVSTVSGFTRQPKTPRYRLPFNKRSSTVSMPPISRMFERVRISGLPYSILRFPEVLSVFCNEVFSTNEIKAREISRNGELTVSLLNPISSKQIIEIQKIAKRQVAIEYSSSENHDDAYDQISIAGIPNVKRLSIVNFGGLSSPFTTSQISDSASLISFPESHRQHSVYL